MIQKERAINWVNTYFSQKEERTYFNLETAVKAKNIEHIVTLSQDLHSLKERKAIIIENIEDASNVVDLIYVIFDDSDIDKELEVEYIEYIFNVQN